MVNDIPCPCLLDLKKHGDGRIVETRQKGKVNHIAYVLVDLRSKVQDEASSIRNLPARLVLFHHTEFNLGLMEWQNSHGILR